MLALQTMLFVKGPGSPGQGYHQDSYYIVSEPDTLIGAWVALDPADEENGCVRIAAGSQHEPVYPDADPSARARWRPPAVATSSRWRAPTTRTRRATGSRRSPRATPAREVPAVLGPGDAVFFGGHVLHRSHANRSATRSRRAFVAHYCNARSAVPWDDEPLAPGTLANDRHLLARGATHLAYARPRFAA